MTTRRNFLKTAATVPLVGKLGARPAPAPVTTCTGEFNDLPPGWARYTNWQINAPRWPEVEGRYHLFPSAGDLLSARLSRPQVIHALGYCSCIAHERDVESVNREWWEERFGVEVRTRRWWRAQEIRLHDCDEFDVCEEGHGVFLHPDDWPLRVHGAG